MIKSGVVSVTFRKKSPRELIDISARAGLQAIEWGSDIHVPQGELALAREVRDMTISAGLDVASYGSYYYVGMDQDFAPYLETAVELGAPNIRIWAGKCPSKTSDKSFRNKVAEDTHRICEEAAKAGITISSEYHANTLTDNLDSAIRFLEDANSPNMYSYWQQPLFVADEDQYPEMKKLFDTGRLTNIHVFAAYRGKFNKRPLAEDTKEWREFLSLLKTDDKLRYALLEFVKDDSDEIFIQDCATLNSLINE